MSDERFILCYDDLGNCEIRYDDKVFRFLWEVAEILNAQQAAIQSLKEENEQLRKELDSFHPVMFQDMRYGTVTLYSKGGIDE